jgi:Tol biopolymer transport system component
MDAFPQWAPDDSAIVFSSNRDHLDDGSGHLELFVIRPDGSNIRKITSQTCCSTRSIDWPSW